MQDIHGVVLLDGDDDEIFFAILFTDSLAIFSCVDYLMHQFCRFPAGFSADEVRLNKGGSRLYVRLVHVGGSSCIVRWVVV